LSKEISLSSIPRRCGHAKSFTDRCIDCELVSAREGLAWAKDGVEKYSKLIAKLEAEQQMQAEMIASLSII
jgi:hypothetical protein